MKNDYMKTPYFLIDKSILDDGLEKLKASLESAWGNYTIGYSYKTNSLPWIIKYFKDNGCFAEVVSDTAFSGKIQII